MTDPLANSGLVVVDKPAGMSSHDVVSRLRRIFGTRKVGHAGTLDPMATGVLVAGIERGTKFLAHMVAATKAYEATIFLGASTSTDDAEGEVLERASTEAIRGLSDTAIERAIDGLRGEILQRPAAVSAIKIDGKRAYQRVRDGESVEIPARPVKIIRFDINNISHESDYVEVEVSVECSSGTYIRSLARDLGEALGVGGHLIALRRTAVGNFLLDDAFTLETLSEHPRLSLSLDEALPRCYPELAVSAEEAEALAMGKWLEPRRLQGIHAAISPDGQAVALVKEQGKRLATVFVARPSTL
ncbi:tRNA pseudouridine(55) synthase TruB [Corynebacterium gerontici]|uniref:tRNA pseudouridine synthase B n=1 Tax=Corynebacterium gerontici TaxID=2079234 RepID=A0A3G6J5D8_9CORY|nr:tRNA pseudouridine(55) synthase TruB [Corynebacterium gerontici]AZA11630.1 tRNA pseudouridine synthase B [Corynebacterium gerontici]